MRCEKLHATITVQRCLENQKARLGATGNYSLRYLGCSDCIQGVKARDGMLDDRDVDELMKRIQEERDMARGGKNPVVDGKKLCSRCGEMKPIERFDRVKHGHEKRRSHCRDCVLVYQEGLRKRRRELMELGKKQMEMQEEPTPRQEIPAPACTQEETLNRGIVESLNRQSPIPDDLPEDKHVLILDFSCYPEILEKIKALADEYERPPEVQARYMLRRVLTPLPENFILSDSRLETMSDLRPADWHPFDKQGNQV